jgi:hypothetical protein
VPTLAREHLLESVMRLLGALISSNDYDATVATR